MIWRGVGLLLSGPPKSYAGNFRQVLPPRAPRRGWGSVDPRKYSAATRWGWPEPRPPAPQNRGGCVQLTQPNVTLTLPDEPRYASRHVRHPNVLVRHDDLVQHPAPLVWHYALTWTSQRNARRGRWIPSPTPNAITSTVRAAHGVVVHSQPGEARHYSVSSSTS